MCRGTGRRGHEHARRNHAENRLHPKRIQSASKKSRMHAKRTHDARRRGKCVLSVRCPENVRTESRTKTRTWFTAKSPQNHRKKGGYCAAPCARLYRLAAARVPVFVRYSRSVPSFARIWKKYKPPSSCKSKPLPDTSSGMTSRGRFARFTASATSAPKISRAFAIGNPRRSPGERLPVSTL